MDYARKLGKSEEPKKWVKQLPMVSSFHDGLIRPERPLYEDHRLTNWRKWLSNRKKQYKHIQSATGRHQTDQILNSCETIRPLIETRTLIEYASAPVPIIPDKYRGGPEFWRPPKILPKRDPCLPDIAFTPSKKDLNQLPELTYVDLPELIEEEKGLTGLKSKKPLWKRSEYLLKRKCQLSKEIELLVPKEPETRNLVIKNYTPPKEIEQPRIPPITISDAEDEDKSLKYPEQVVVLKIQDREIVWQRFASRNEETESEPITWSLIFSGEVNKREEREIVFENKGNRVILYQWRDAAVRSKIMPLRRRTSPFFFNKTKGVIPPGQIVKLKIWHKACIPGIFTEFWKLLTDPELCSSPLTFRFWGCARSIRNAENDSTRLVDGYLNRCIRDSVIRDVINDIIEGVGSMELPEPAYGSLFLESEIFRAKNPMCFYHPSILIEFHKIYYSATNQRTERWNLSIEDLREILLKIKQPERRHSMLTQFSQLYKECLKPTLYSPMRWDKHEMVQNLLCSFLNRFEIENECSKHACFERACKEDVGEASEMENIASIGDSEVSVKSDGRSKSIICFEGDQRRPISDITGFNERVHKEIFFIRIHELLEETLERIFAAIDSFDNLNECDK